MGELERMLELFPEKEAPNINTAFRKLHANLKFRSEVAAVSISGGADSDMMLDMIMALDPAKNYPDSEIHYVWFDTGIEYTATKQHLKDLEEKYGITIERKKAKTPVPLGCKTWGQPFISKQISQYISRLQAHGFKWEDEPFDVLYQRYPNCKAALRWWCNAFGPGSRLNIEKCRLLKEFIIANPPDFPISDGCCKGAKKDVAHDYIMPLGHGPKSAMIVKQYIELTTPEMYAIWHHMGMTGDRNNDNAVGASFEKYPLALALHTADMMASRLMEDEKENKALFAEPSQATAGDFGEDLGTGEPEHEPPPAEGEWQEAPPVKEGK